MKVDCYFYILNIEIKYYKPVESALVFFLDSHERVNGIKSTRISRSSGLEPALLGYFNIRDPSIKRFCSTVALNLGDEDLLKIPTPFGDTDNGVIMVVGVDVREDGDSDKASYN